MHAVDHLNMVYKSRLVYLMNHIHAKAFSYNPVVCPQLSVGQD